MCLKKISASLVLFSFVIVSTGCQSNEEYYEADVYSTEQVNSKQETKTINILSILPARIAVDNMANKKFAEKAGTLSGLVTGAVMGYNRGDIGGAIVGGYSGGAVGSLAGNVVSDKKIVEGVSLTYKEGTKVYTSTQVGKKCQFQLGLAAVITTKSNETRVQPNATCPTKK